MMLKLGLPSFHLAARLQYSVCKTIEQTTTVKTQGKRAKNDSVIVGSYT